MDNVSVLSETDFDVFKELANLTEDVSMTEANNVFQSIEGKIGQPLPEDPSLHSIVEMEGDDNNDDEDTNSELSYTSDTQTQHQTQPTPNPTHVMNDTSDTWKTYFPLRWTLLRS